MSGEITTHDLARSTEAISVEIYNGRVKAHTKHGPNSIEATNAFDPQWLAILGEEFGELAHEYTYDAGKLVDVYDGQPLSPGDLRLRRLERMRAEAVDVATVSVALIAAIDREMHR